VTPEQVMPLVTYRHLWSRVRRYAKRWRCRRCGRLFHIRTYWPCARQLVLPLWDDYEPG
jgi:transposase-like protein